MTANLTSWIGNQENFLIIKNESERMGVRILPPDINSSEGECSIDKEISGLAWRLSKCR